MTTNISEETIAISKEIIHRNETLELEIETNLEVIDVKKVIERDLKHKEQIFNFFKRAFDVIFSLVLLLITSPVILLFSVLIKLESKGPILYSQKRVGKNNKEFTIYKLRSMIVNAEKNGAVWAMKNDSRVTRIGKIVRMTRIDELPQLINVLYGEMSIVGPRPERKVFIDEFSSSLPRFHERTKVKPGLTGLAQVTGGYELSPSEKLSFDIYYIENKSLIFEIIILIKTIKVVIGGEGAR